MAKIQKLIREIEEITNNPDIHFWPKCKELTRIKTYNRPGSSEGSALIRIFFETCSGRFKDRFKSAYARPYLDSWQDDYRAYDHVNGKALNNDLACKIGRNPRGITDTARKPDSQERFASYIKAKYPDAFVEFEEIKKGSHYNGSVMKKTNDCAWHHIFGHRVSNCPYLSFHGDNDQIALWQTPKETQLNRRRFDLDMEKAQKDYDKLKEASALPPRYLYNEVSLAELQHEHKNHTYATFKRHYITTDTVLHYDNSSVAHGLGRLVQTDRSLTIRCKDGTVVTWRLDAYRGNFALNAVEERFGRVNALKPPSGLKPVQLNPKMEVVEIAKCGRFRVFKRLFSGVHYDYCVLRNGSTQHGTTIEQCLKGWRKKKALLKPGVKIVNMKTVKALGFCVTGIRQFCATNNIDSNADYTIPELKAIVNKNLSYNTSYYGRELRQAGIL